MREPILRSYCAKTVSNWNISSPSSDERSMGKSSIRSLIPCSRQSWRVRIESSRLRNARSLVVITTVSPAVSRSHNCLPAGRSRSGTDPETSTSVNTRSHKGSSLAACASALLS
jgi:hypothetical protein